MIWILVWHFSICKMYSLGFIPLNYSVICEKRVGLNQAITKVQPFFLTFGINNHDVKSCQDPWQGALASLRAACRKAASVSSSIELVKPQWLIHIIEYRTVEDYMREWKSVHDILSSEKVDHKTLLVLPILINV